MSNEDGVWLTYSPKLESLPPDSLRAVTATREGAVLRFWRLSQQFWASSLSVPYEESAEMRNERLLAMLKNQKVPPKERAFIIEQIANGYPWLDALYSEELV